MDEKITFSISHSACLRCKRDDDGDDDENDDHDAYYDDGSQKRITILCPLLSGTGRNLVRTCKPMTRLVRGTSILLIRKNTETCEN